MKKSKLGSFLINTFVIVFVILFIYSFYKIDKWQNEYKNNENLKNNLIEQNTPVKKEPKYEDMNIKESISNAKSQNKDTIGWIHMDNSKINYPFVQTNDNSYYLNHAFDHSETNTGTIFIDYRNNPDFSDKNTIFYGHGRLDNSMFGSIRMTLNDEWVNKSDTHLIQVETENHKMIYQIFSIYVIPTTSDYIQVNFKGNDFMNLINTIKNRSRYDFNVEVNNNDKIITLSTCLNEAKKIVVHAKLIETK